MLKKSTIIFLILIGGLTLSSCKRNDSVTTFNHYLGSFNDIIIQTLPNNDDNVQFHLEHIHSIFRTYHKLTNAFEPFPGVNNVYTINNSNGQWVTVDERLYNILYFAYTLQNNLQDLDLSFDIPFNILIAEISMIWKEFIDFGTDRNPYPFAHLLDAPLYRMNNSTIIFDRQGNNHRVRIEGGAQIDLGALAKGYVTQLVHNYLREQNIDYFLINSGSSSMHIGQHYLRDTNNWHIGISGTNQLFIHRLLGLQNIAVSTSGSQTQRRVFNGNTYSHIVNPSTGSAQVGQVGSVSIISNETHISDILSTAFFHLSIEQIIEMYRLIRVTEGFDPNLMIIVIDANNNLVYESKEVLNYVITP